MRKLPIYLLNKDFVKNTLLKSKTLTPRLTASKLRSTTTLQHTNLFSKNTNLQKLETQLSKMKSTDLRLIKLVLKPLFYPKKPLLNLSVKTLMLLNKIESMLPTLPIFKPCKTKTSMLPSNMDTTDCNKDTQPDHKWDSVYLITLISVCDQTEFFKMNYLIS